VEYYDDEPQNDRLGNKAANRLVDGVMSKDGRVLGGLMQVPESLAVVIRGLQPIIKEKLADVSEKPVATAVTAIAKAAHVSDATAHKAGDMTAKVVKNVVLPYVDNIGDVGTSVKIHREKRKALLAELAPLLNANMEAKKGKGVVGAITGVFDRGYSDNKMVEAGLKAITDETYANLTKDAVNTIPSVVVNYTQHLKGRLETATANNDQAEVASINKSLENNKLWLGGAGVSAEELGKHLANKSDDKFSQTSLNKVRELQEYIRGNNLDGLDRLVSDSAVAQVADRVADIFQTYQKEQGHKAIPSHRLKDVSQAIAEELVGGELHALSLVNIIGKDRLLTESKDGLASADKVKTVLKDEISHFSKASTITAQEYLDGAGYTMDDVKAHLSSKDKDVRAMVAVLHPDSVLLEAGAKKDEIKEMRSHVSKKMMEGVYSAVLNGLNQQSAEQLETLGLDRRDMKYLEEHEGQPIQAELRNKANEAHVKKIVAKALMGEEEVAHGNQQSTAWRDAIAAGKANAAKVGNVGHGRKPAANDESHAAPARKGHAANDAQHQLTANASKGGGRTALDYVDRDSGEIHR